jgi:hypothetical protein
VLIVENQPFFCGCHLRIKSAQVFIDLKFKSAHLVFGSFGSL